jgi:hypothetical protein
MARRLTLFTARLHRFTDKGLAATDGEALADKLVVRDREARRPARFAWSAGTCPGMLAGSSWRCGNWQAAGVAIRSRDCAVAC